MMPTVLVIRKEDQFSQILREAGLDVINLELIKTQPVADLAALREKLDRLSNYDGLFFTSQASAEVFAGQYGERNDYKGSVYVLGDRARKILESAGLNVVFRDSANTIGELLSSFENSEFDGKTFLFLRGDKSMRTVPDFLNGRASVDEVIVYETKPIQPAESTVAGIAAQIRNHDIAWVCFFSPSGIEQFQKLFGVDSSIKAAAIGTTTAQKAESYGFSVQFISNRSTAEDFANGLIERITNKNSEIAGTG
jgi:uroporphyrinogen-III synthase